jgi:hypothetical protein
LRVDDVSGLSSVLPNLDVPVRAAGGEDLGMVMVPGNLRNHTKVTNYVKYTKIKDESVNDILGTQMSV